MDRQPDIERIQRQITKAERQIGVLVDQICAHPENADAFNKKILETKARKSALERHLQEIEDLVIKDIDMKAAVSCVMEEIRNFHSLFEDNDLDAQKEVIRKFVKEVKVNFDKREVTVYLYPSSKMLIGASRDQLHLKKSSSRWKSWKIWGKRPSGNDRSTE